MSLTKKGIGPLKDFVLIVVTVRHLLEKGFTLTMMMFIKMCGILIYTSFGDAEVSFGGLVRECTEQYLSKLVKEAIEEAR